MQSSNKLKRGLKSRHLTMMALGGTIGTGLLLASGRSIHIAGPGGAILAYTLVGLLVYIIMSSLGEMATYLPVTGSFCDYAARYVDKAFGFAMSWNYWFNWVLVVASELLAAGLVMQYWFPGLSPWLWTFSFFILIIVLNLCAVKLYGEMEYWMAFVKISTIIIFLIIGVCAIFGVFSSTGAVGFKNIHVGDAPFHAGFLGFFGVFLIAGYSFQGSELVGIAVGEVKNPRQAIPKAIRTIFWRILIFYVLTLTIIGFLIPYTSSYLLTKGSTVAMSPFTLVLQSTGLHYAASIMNVVVITAIISTANASLYTASRVMWHIGNVKEGPEILRRTNHKGVPISAVIISSVILGLFVLSSVIGSGAVFAWLVNMISLAGYIAWLGICLSHLRFRKAYLAQGNALADLPYTARWFPIAPIVAIGAMLIMMIGQQVLEIIQGKFTFLGFFETYCGVLLFGLLYLGYKLVRKTKLIALKDCQLTSGGEH